MINAKKKDALNFVTLLEGDWDCVIWDPPYLTKAESKSYQKPNVRNHNQLNRKPETIYCEPGYLLKVKGEILTKMHQKYVWFDFFKNPRSTKDFLIWNKQPAKTRMGNNVLNNVEFINYEFKNYSLSNHINKCISIPKTENKISKAVAFSKPIALYLALLKWVLPNKVLDPFAGSYNSAKACELLGINIDICDKYFDPPNSFKSNLYKIL